MSEFVILIPQAFEAVSLAEIRAYLRIGSDADNATLSLLQKAATTNVEMRNHRALAKRKVRQSFTSHEVEKAIAQAHKMRGAIYLRPAFAPSAIFEVRAIAENGSSAIISELVTIEANKFRLGYFAQSLEIDYFAGSETFEDIPSELKIEVLEELGRLIAVRDNEKTQNPSAEVHL